MKQNQQLQQAIFNRIRIVDNNGKHQKPVMEAVSSFMNNKYWSFYKQISRYG